ncbi:hypothetical protein LT493_30025 [Streptomyces tricolor]|nr:hypothetical protein [Streptomyces tricolor]
MSAPPGTVPHRRSGTPGRGRRTPWTSAGGARDGGGGALLRECQSLGCACAGGRPAHRRTTPGPAPLLPPAELPGDPATLAAWRAEHTHGASPPPARPGLRHRPTAGSGAPPSG